METQRNNFLSILLENEKTYFKHLEGVVSSVDHMATLNITRRLEGLTVRIAPSEYSSLLMILEEMKKLHTMLGITVEFSKSMKAANNICFNININ